MAQLSPSLSFVLCRYIKVDVFIHGFHLIVDSTDKSVKKNINEINKWYESVFQGIGGLKVDPINVLLSEI